MLFCHALAYAIIADGSFVSPLLSHSAASCQNCMYYNINRWVYFRGRSILWNNFTQKSAVGRDVTSTGF